MATRRFNYVGRKEIAAQNISLVTRKMPDGEVNVQFDSLELPKQAKGDKHILLWPLARVILRARDKVADVYYTADIGSVSEVSTRVGCLHNAVMDGFTDISTIKLSLIVVASNKVILASNEDFSANNDKPQERDELFQLRTEDLGEECWLIDWSGEAPQVVLDTEFAESFEKSHVANALILPAAFREVLKKAVVCDEDGAEEWVRHFIDFAQGFGGPRPEDEADHDDWIERSVSRFARTNQFKSLLIKAHAPKDGE